MRSVAELMSMRAWSALVGLVVAVLAGCATKRPDPPPYPQVAASAQFRAQWTYGGVGRASNGFAPAVVGDEVWAASESGRISIVDAGNGRFKRSIEAGARLAAGVGSNGRLQVVVSRDGDLLAFDSAGKRRWRSPLGAEVTTAPSVSDHAVAVRAVDGRIVLLEPEDGTIRWTWRQQPLPALTLRQSSPMVFDDDVLFAGLPGARLVALDLKLGAPRWEQIIASARGATELERLIDVAGAPAVDDERVCAIAYQGRLACLRKDDGRVVWARDVASAYGMSLADDRIATIDGADRVLALQVGGDELWRQDAYVRRAMTRPVLVGDYVVFGDRAGSIHVLAAGDGTPLARLSPDGKAITAAAVMSQRVAYFQTAGGSLVALPLR
jgi:outer membrane protein assembly factor BamB